MISFTETFLQTSQLTNINSLYTIQLKISSKYFGKNYITQKKNIMSESENSSYYCSDK